MKFKQSDKHFFWPFLLVFIIVRAHLVFRRTNKILKNASTHLILEFHVSLFIFGEKQRMISQLGWTNEKLFHRIVSHDFSKEAITTYLIEQRVSVKIKQRAVKHNFHQLRKWKKRSKETPLIQSDREKTLRCYRFQDWHKIHFFQVTENNCVLKLEHVILWAVQNTRNDNNWSVSKNMTLATGNSNEIFVKNLNRFNQTIFRVL